MKKFILLNIVALASICLFSCSKDNSSEGNNSHETSLAKAQFDGNNYGIYKGVFVGSSGIVVININNDNTITALLKIDGRSYNFTTTQQIQQNQPTTIDFTDGTNSFKFSVSGDGTNPTTSNILINGHPDAIIVVVKETSTDIVKCFEGNFTGDDKGTFNAVIYKNSIKAIAKSITGGYAYIASGSVTDGQFSTTSGTVTTGATFTGTINGDKISGTWTNSSINWSGSWSGSRTY